MISRGFGLRREIDKLQRVMPSLAASRNVSIVSRDRQRKESMDFIERLLHVAPDDGSGMLEFAILFAAFVIPFLLTVWRKTVKAPREPHSGA
jgi:hypothetical protein